MNTPEAGSGKSVWEGHWQNYIPSRGENWLISQRQQLLNALLIMHFGANEGLVRVVEAGCRVGHNAYQCAIQHVVLAVDISRAALSLHRLLYPASRANLAMADIRNLPLPSNSADLIYNAGVLEHFTDVEKGSLLGEWRRVLRPRGILFITVPGRYSLWHLWRQLGRLDFGYEEYHTIGSLRAILEANGFRVVQTGGIDPLSLNTFLMRFFGVALPVRGFPGAFNTEVFCVARPLRA